MQNTLELFHESSKRAELSHRLTKNLADMQYHMDAHEGVSKRQIGKSSSTLQHNRLDSISSKRLPSQAEREKLHAWDGFAELVGMAEGSASLLLGKVRSQKSAGGIHSQVSAEPPPLSRTSSSCNCRSRGSKQAHYEDGISE